MSYIYSLFVIVMIAFGFLMWLHSGIVAAIISVAVATFIVAILAISKINGEWL